ncbi:MAG: dihydroorotate dehydrogenase [Chloroflexota bacterium]|nr:dihydroorotate dehydrogenase [Chloroflexota bacterium]
MIELAPHHKYGLPLPHPVMPAAGSFGYGEEYHELLDYDLLGALVTNPVSLRPRKAARPPRSGTRGDHFIIHTGLPNPGLKRVLRAHRAFWARQSLPIIVHLVATTPAEVAAACSILSGERGVAGIELGLDENTPPAQAVALLHAARSTSVQPLIARVPFGGVESLAQPLAENGADALTLTAPPRALLPAPGAPEDFMRGRLYGPALFPLLLHTLARWVERLPVPIIACGGVASPEDARACLALGAVAVQVDALLWRDPVLLEHIAKELNDDRTTKS